MDQSNTIQNYGKINNKNIELGYKVLRITLRGQKLLGKRMIDKHSDTG